MMTIDPVPLELIDDPGLKERLDQAQEIQTPDPLFLQIMAHVPSYAKAVFDAMYRSHVLGNVDHKLKEIIRIQLARLAKDTYFANLRSAKARQAGLTEEMIEAGCGDFENDEGFSKAEKWALRYAYLMFRERNRVDKTFYDEGKTLYSEAEIMELGAFIAFHYGLQVFMRTLQAFPAQDRDGNPVSQEESAALYGTTV
jgi:hypothetical protein